MSQPAMTISQMRHEEALRRARKRAREIRSFYISATMYAIVIPFLWIVNLSTGTKIWAHWATFGWGIGLTIHGLSVFAGRSFFGSEWEERKVEELMARENLKVVSNEKQVVQAQMRMLQAQIEPHFLFNTLATIQSLIARAPDKAELMMDNFIAYLRQSLSASRSQEGTVKQEIELLRHYLDLLKIRMGPRLEYDLEIAPGLESEPLAPMLLQPVVENAIKHGLEPKIEGGRVRVSATRADSHMLLRVTDNGLGFAEHADSKGQGVGLANLRERLAVLYDGRAALTVADAKPGTDITLSIPLAALAAPTNAR
ncbi:MAG: 2TM domain-containing protein [Betaproteobacteria bacterium]|nr:2TM domain-containing protein [Betaproteobacteria bacterium]